MKIESFGTSEAWLVLMTREDGVRFDTAFFGPNAERRATSYIAVWGEALRNNGGLARDYEDYCKEKSDHK